MTLYCVLDRNDRACHGGSKRAVNKPGVWTARRKARMCESGWHATTLDHLAEWLYAESDDDLPLRLWECELESPVAGGSKVVGTRRRLTRLVGELDEYDLRWLATEYAIIVWSLSSSTDPVVPDIITTLRAWLCSLASDDEAAWAALAARAAWDARAARAARAAWDARAARAARDARDAWAAWAAWDAWDAWDAQCSQAILDYLKDGAR